MYNGSVVTVDISKSHDKLKASDASAMLEKFNKLKYN